MQMLSKLSNYTDHLSEPTPVDFAKRCKALKQLMAFALKLSITNSLTGEVVEVGKEAWRTWVIWQQVSENLFCCRKKLRKQEL